MNKLFVILMFLLFVSCKKDKKSAEEDACHGSHTFSKNITSVMGSATVLSIYEDNSGGIHVSANDNGALKIFQFDNNGNFIRNVSLGVYNIRNTLTVADAYYITSYTEQDQAGAGTPGLYQGFKQLTQFSTNCVGYYVFDTFTMPSRIHSAITTVNKIDFTGNSVWTQNYNGYLPGSWSPVVFSSDGSMYLFTIDYKGEKRQFLINDTVYSYTDANRPNFYLTDTVLLNDTIHSFIVNSVDPATGNVLWQKTHLFNFYEDGFSFCPVVLSNGILASCGGLIYALDLQGNYLRDIHPLFNDCPGNFGFFIKKAFGNDNIYILGEHLSNRFLALTDAAGNPMWNISYYNQNFDALIPVSSGFIFSTHSGTTIDLYSQNGLNYNSIQLCNYVGGCNGNGSSYTCASCSGDILHVFMSSSGNAIGYWLVRTNGNGVL